MRITTLPVYSKLADEKDIPPDVQKALPKCLRLSQHQLETYLALTQGDADVIFNTAMTGDGKSLAGQLPALVKGGINWTGMAMFPTNELISDQHAHLESTTAYWNADVKFGLLNGAELDRVIADDNYALRGEALARILRNNDLVLTNPDIFHYVMHQFYTLPQDAPDRYSGLLAQKFEQLTFDEFHIFDAPQMISVLNALLFIREIGGVVRANKFLFLSATPSEIMLNYLSRSGLKVHEINGEYATSGNTEHWRKILDRAEVEFEPEPHAETWIVQHLEDVILPFFLERRPHAKGAIIVNSVASAYRIHDLIKPIFEKYGLSVEPNTGLTSRSRRKASYDADLLVGTSTVDVGVDFQINFLVFESRDAGSFLQRLGRMGRHAGYIRDGQTFAFQDYRAYALVPGWIADRLFKGGDGMPPFLVDNSEIDREKLNQAVQDAYPPATTFDKYAQCWGKFQSIKILWGLGRRPIKEQYKETRAKLQNIYEQVFGVHLSSGFYEYKELNDSRSPLLQEALSFRGGDEFPCCVIDTSEPNPVEQFKNADLLQMIANHSLEYLSEKEFYVEVAKAGLKHSVFESQEPLAFFHLIGVQSERQNCRFFLDKDLLYWSAEKFGKACALSGFRIEANFPGSVEINNRLQRRALPALLCSGLHSMDVKRRLSLPLLFPLYEFTSRDEVTGTVAFGRTALMLHSRLLYHPMPCGGGAIIT